MCNFKQYPLHNEDLEVIISKYNTPTIYTLIELQDIGTFNTLLPIYNYRYGDIVTTWIKTSKLRGYSGLLIPTKLLLLNKKLKLDSNYQYEFDLRISGGGYQRVSILIPRYDIVCTELNIFELSYKYQDDFSKVAMFINTLSKHLFSELCLIHRLLLKKYNSCGSINDIRD